MADARDYKPAENDEKNMKETKMSIGEYLEMFALNPQDIDPALLPDEDSDEVTEYE